MRPHQDLNVPVKVDLEVVAIVEPQVGTLFCAPHILEGLGPGQSPTGATVGRVGASLQRIDDPPTAEPRSSAGPFAFFEGETTTLVGSFPKNK